MGQPLPAKGREEAKVRPDVMSRWFEGIGLPITEEPPAAVLPDYLSAMESGRFA